MSAGIGTPASRAAATQASSPASGPTSSGTFRVSIAPVGVNVIAMSFLPEGTGAACASASRRGVVMGCGPRSCAVEWSPGRSGGHWRVARGAMPAHSLYWREPPRGRPAPPLRGDPAPCRVCRPERPGPSRSHGGCAPRGGRSRGRSRRLRLPLRARRQVPVAAATGLVALVVALLALPRALDRPVVLGVAQGSVDLLAGEAELAGARPEVAPALRYDRRLDGDRRQGGALGCVGRAVAARRLAALHAAVLASHGVVLLSVGSVEEAARTGCAAPEGDYPKALV